jgi:hypothetical protein
MNSDEDEGAVEIQDNECQQPFKQYKQLNILCMAH